MLGEEYVQRPSGNDPEILFEVAIGKWNQTGKESELFVFRQDDPICAGNTGNMGLYGPISTFPLSCATPEKSQ